MTDEGYPYSDWISESVEDVLVILDDLYYELGENFTNHTYPTYGFDVETWTQINRILDAYHILSDVKRQLAKRRTHYRAIDEFGREYL